MKVLSQIYNAASKQIGSIGISALLNKILVSDKYLDSNLHFGIWRTHSSLHISTDFTLERFVCFFPMPVRFILYFESFHVKFLCLTYF